MNSKGLSQADRLRAREIITELDRRKQNERSRYFRASRADDQNPNFPAEGCNPQHEVIMSPAMERWIFGGNRSGKTETAVEDCYMFCVGTHPYRSKDRRPPVKVRYCAPKWRDGIEGVILPKFKEIVQRRHLRGGSWAKAWSQSLHKLYFANGTVIQFKSGEEDKDTYGGVDLDAVYIDEHIREDLYLENKARLADRNGYLFGSMTPELGVTWEGDHVEAEQRDDEGNLIEVAYWFFHQKRNPFLSKKGVLNFLASIKDEKQRETKEKGAFHPLSGVVIPQYDPRVHIVPDTDIPENWARVFCIDTHHRTPSAAMWCAWQPKGPECKAGCLWVYRTLKGRFTIPEWQKIIRARSGGEYIVAMLLDQPGHTTGVDINEKEPIITQFQSGPLALPIHLVSKDGESSFNSGILKLWEMFSIDVMDNTTRIKIFQSCDWPPFSLDGKPHGGLPWELKKYRYKKEQAQDEEMLREKVVLVNDHLIDCLRYIVMYGPPIPQGNIKSALDGSW